jgi:maleate cis-trans isomerase
VGQKSMSLTTPQTAVFIDPAVEEYQKLAINIIGNAKVIILDPYRDGVKQIGQTLDSFSALESIHVISHGQPGCLQLGMADLTVDTLNYYTTYLQRWSKALAPDGNILLYGCCVAAGELGERFIHTLHKLTQAAIAASTTLTGAAALGGNWNLDAKIGEIHAPLAFRQEILDCYPYVLRRF